jgi:hypothetical protein
MTQLKNKKYEAYAQGRAKGLGVDESYAKAGYSPDHGSAGKVARRPDVVARVAELRERDPDNTHPDAIIARLLRVADACCDLNSAAALKEARLSLMEAYRLRTQTKEDDYEIPRPMGRDEWMAKYAAKED